MMTMSLYWYRTGTHRLQLGLRLAYGPGVWSELAVSLPGEAQPEEIRLRLNGCDLRDEGVVGHADEFQAKKKAQIEK